MARRSKASLSCLCLAGLLVSCGDRLAGGPGVQPTAVAGPAVVTTLPPDVPTPPPNGAAVTISPSKRPSKGADFGSPLGSAAQRYRSVNEAAAAKASLAVRDSAALGPVEFVQVDDAPDAIGRTVAVTHLHVAGGGRVYVLTREEPGISDAMTVAYATGLKENIANNPGVQPPTTVELIELPTGIHAALQYDSEYATATIMQSGLRILVTGDTEVLAQIRAALADVSTK